MKAMASPQADQAPGLSLLGWREDFRVQFGQPVLGGLLERYGGRRLYVPRQPDSHHPLFGPEPGYRRLGRGARHGAVMRLNFRHSRLRS